MSDKKRIAIFAHYDKDKVIDDYVIYYLRALKEICETIIFVSDCDLQASEIEKISDIAKVIAQPHGEYDFGSYKRGFIFALGNNILNDIDECIFANDSCYGPFHPIKSIFETMDEKNCDFWGITRNETGFYKQGNKYLKCKSPHIQSYFLVFKKNVFLSETFINFIKSIKKEEKKQDIIINYELQFSKILELEGFKSESFVQNNIHESNLMILRWKEAILKYNLPFLKCSLPRLENMQYTVIKGYGKVIKKVSDYPIELIYKNVQRVAQNKDFLWFIPRFARPYIYKAVYYAQRRIDKLSSAK